MVFDPQKPSICLPRFQYVFMFFFQNRPKKTMLRSKVLVYAQKCDCGDIWGVGGLKTDPWNTILRPKVWTRNSPHRSGKFPILELSILGPNRLSSSHRDGIIQNMGGFHTRVWNFRSMYLAPLWDPFSTLLFQNKVGRYEQRPQAKSKRQNMSTSKGLNISKTMSKRTKHEQRTRAESIGQTFGS